MVSCCSLPRSLLYFFWSSLSCGWMICMDCAELNCFQVSGKSTRRTMIVRPMMARPQLQFGPSPSEAKAPLIVTRIQCSSRMSCLRTGTLYTGAHVRLAVLMLASFVARRHRVVATVAEGIAAQQAPRGQTEAADGAVLTQRLHGVVGARRVVPAARPQQRRDRVPVHPDEGDEDLAHEPWTSSRTPARPCASFSSAPASSTRSRAREQDLRRLRPGVPVHDLAAAGAALQVLPVVLQLRRGGAARTRRPPRPRSGHVAPAALQSLQQRWLRPGAAAPQRVRA